MPDITVTTMNDLPGYRGDEVFGEVFGLTVRAATSARTSAPSSRGSSAAR